MPTAASTAHETTRRADRASPVPGIVIGHAAVVLRLEGATALVAAVLAYRHLSASWWLFALLFLAPDLSMLGYIINRAAGAALYNFGHTYLTPACLAAVGFMLGAPMLYALALIWVAHIGADRLLGYGLKYPPAFGATHLGWRGGGTYA